MNPRFCMLSDEAGNVLSVVTAGDYAEYTAGGNCVFEFSGDFDIGQKVTFTPILQQAGYDAASSALAGQDVRTIDISQEEFACQQATTADTNLRTGASKEKR